MWAKRTHTRFSTERQPIVPLQPQKFQILCQQALLLRQPRRAFHATFYKDQCIPACIQSHFIKCLVSRVRDDSVVVRTRPNLWIVANSKIISGQPGENTCTVHKRNGPPTDVTGPSSYQMCRKDQISALAFFYRISGVPIVRFSSSNLLSPQPLFPSLLSV